MADRFVPLRPRIGARCDVGREELLRPAFADECLDALEQYGVLVFPELGLSDAEHVAFSENLGEIIPMGRPRPDGSRGPLFQVSIDPDVNPAAEYILITFGWHVDGLVEDAPPPRATLLTARRLAAEGGQTEFCNTYAAYDDLSDEDRRRCESLTALHTVEAAKRRLTPDPSPEDLERWRHHGTANEHPVVWRHRSGRKSLVLGVEMQRIVGLPDAESDALIERLNAHATRPELVYRHEWRVGDLVMWDNCGVMHRVDPYDLESGRLMHRTTLYGSERIEGVGGSGPSA